MTDTMDARLTDRSPAYISPLQVALGAVAIIVNVVTSITMKLDIEWQLAVGAVRWAKSPCAFNCSVDFICGLLNVRYHDCILICIY